MTPSDSQLLHAYVHERSDDSFAELVRRHIDWVYSAAVRIVGDKHLAEDVVQTTFIVLSQNGPRLLTRQHLAPWLFEVVRRTSANALRSKGRRTLHERKAATMTPESTHSSTGQSDWQPLLDELVGQLRKKDQRLVLMRFYERKSFAEVGTAEGISEDSARKRVERAIEKLRQMFERRGIATLSAATLTAELSQIVQPAQGAFVTQAITTALTSTPGSTVVSAPWLSLFTWSSAKIAAAIVALLTVLAAGAGVLQFGGPTTVPQPALTPARELFNRYQASADWKKSAAMIYQIESEQTGENPGRRRGTSIYYRDGQREQINETDDLMQDGEIVRTDRSLEVLGNRFYFRSSGMQSGIGGRGGAQGNSYLTTFSLRDKAPEWRLEGHAASLDADYTLNLSTPMFKEAADQLRLRDTEDVIDDVPCKVLEGQLRGVDLKIWIAPSRGHQAMKQLVEWDGPDVMRDKTLDSMGISRITYTVDGVKIEQFDGVWVPVAGEGSSKAYYKDGRETFTRIAVRRTGVQIKPDFAALGAFAVSVPVGTRIRQEEDKDGSFYQWRSPDPIPVDQIPDQLGRKLGPNEAPEIPVPEGSIR